MLIIYLSLLIVIVIFNILTINGNVKIEGKIALCLSAIDYFLIILLIVIMSNSNYSDLQNYEYHFGFSKNKMMESRFEIGFNTFMYICKFVLHFNFFQFKFVTYFICMLLIYSTYRKFTYNFSLFLFPFILYEMFFDGIQIRNFIAISIIFFGLPYLLQRKIRGTIVYLFCVVIASLFHSSAIAFAVLALANINLQKIYNNKYLKATAIVCFSVIVIVLIYGARNGKLVELISKLSYQYISNDVGNRIMSHSGGKSHSGPIFLTVIYLAYIIFVHIFNSYIKNIGIVNYALDFKVSKVKILKIVVSNEMLENIEKLNYIGMLFIPLIYLSTTYYRLLRNICFIDMLFYSIIINNMKNKNVKIMIFISMFCLICLWDYYDLIIPHRFIEHVMGYLGEL